MIVANVRAMGAALKLADRLSEQSILAMHRELLLRQPGWESYAGIFRDGLVWVGGDRASPRGARHIAPQADLVPGAIDDMLAFARRDDVPVLEQAAIPHAQF